MKIVWGLALLAAALAAPAQASRAAELGAIEVHDRTSGRTLPVHEHQGRKYVVGEPGHEYEVVVRNYTGGRVLAVTSVDGVNVISGETAAPLQSGYVLPAYGSTGIAGWRKSMAEIAAFYFTPHRNSYAARTGRPFDVGVIGVALFREKTYCCRRFRDDAESRSQDRAAEGAAAPAMREEQTKLGTGHGRREESHASYTEFERASDTPDEVIAIYYDSRANLVAQGVLPRDREHAGLRRPRPFPGSFVPDP
jgi:hypothetical protein